MKLSKYPLLKVLIPLVSGILVSNLCQWPFKMCYWWLSSAATCVLVAIVLLPFKAFFHQWLHTIPLLLGFFFAGMAVTTFRQSLRLSPEKQTLTEKEQRWIVRVADFPTEREKSMKMTAEVLQTAAGVPMKGKTLLYLSKSAESAALTHGDILIISATLKPLLPPANPDAFDYRKYMQKKGVFYTAYTGDGGWQLLGRHTFRPLKAISHRIQSYLSSVFTAAGMSGPEYDIINAILLGDDDTMDPELKRTYAAAGVSHILCVSGMHVGVIFMILDFLLKPLDLFRTTRRLKAVVILFFIWFYAHITGLAPSVSRSAAMFTFVTAGSLLNRRTTVFHSLFASLFVLLSINPMLLLDIGFQLSYLAVFGIVLIQPLLAKIYTCKTKAGNYFWELATVSIAAQISTFPISVHYFGQFPNYFLLSNISVIALSFIVMATGIVLLVIAFIPTVAKAVSFCLIWEIKAMNGIISFVERLPGAVTNDIDCSTAQALLLYALIILFFMALHFRKKKYAWGAFVTFALFSGTFLLRKMALQRQDELCAYSIRNTSAVSFCRKQQCVLFSDSINTTAHPQYGYAIRNHARRQHAELHLVPIDTPRYDATFIHKRDNFILFGNRRCYLLKSKERVFILDKPMPVDVLLLQYNPRQSPDEVAKAIAFKSVVADATSSEYCLKRWRAWCADNGIPFRQ